MSGSDTVLPNFATVATFSCFEPYKKSVTALASQPKLQRVLRGRTYTMVSDLDQLKHLALTHDSRYTCQSDARPDHQVFPQRMEKWAFDTWPACGVVQPMLASFGCSAESIMRARTVDDQFHLMQHKAYGLNRRLFSYLVEIYITLSQDHCSEVVAIVKQNGPQAINFMSNAAMRAKDSVLGQDQFAWQQRHKIILAPFSDFMNISRGTINFGDAGGVRFRTLRPSDMQDILRAGCPAGVRRPAQPSQQDNALVDEVIQQMQQAHMQHSQPQQPEQAPQEPAQPDDDDLDVVEAPHDQLEDEDDDFELAAPPPGRAGPSQPQRTSAGGRSRRRSAARTQRIVSSSDEEEEEGAEEPPISEFIVSDDSGVSESEEESAADSSDGDSDSNESENGSNVDEDGRSAGGEQEVSGVEWGSEGVQMEEEDLQVRPARIPRKAKANRTGIPSPNRRLTNRPPVQPAAGASTSRKRLFASQAQMQSVQKLLPDGLPEGLSPVTLSDDSPGLRITGYDPRDESVEVRRTANGIAVFWSSWGKPEERDEAAAPGSDLSDLEEGDDGAPAPPGLDDECSARPSTRKRKTAPVSRAGASGSRGSGAGPSPKQRRRTQRGSQGSGSQSGVPRGLLKFGLSSDQPGYIIKGFESSEVETKPTLDGLAVFWSDWEDE